MTIRFGDGIEVRHFIAAAAPFLIVAVAGIAVRMPLAADYPFVALLLFLWIVADTLMLALLARSSGRPEWTAVLGTLAGACLTVGLGSPKAVRDELLRTPALAVAMAAVILAHVAWATVRAARVLSGSGRDREGRWRAAASEILPPALVRLATAELTILHMALFRWGGPADVPANARAFGYHRHLTPVCATLLILSAIEMAAYHLLVGHWSRTAAVVMFVLSDVGFVYLVGLIKSFRFRPVLLTPDGVRVRAGLLVNELVPLDSIVAVEGDLAAADVRDAGTLDAALLAWPNVLLRLERPVIRHSLLGRRRAYDKVAFRLDDPEPFLRLLSWRLGGQAH